VSQKFFGYLEFFVKGTYFYYHRINATVVGSKQAKGDDAKEGGTNAEEAHEGVEGDGE